MKKLKTRTIKITRKWTEPNIFKRNKFRYKKV